MPDILIVSPSGSCRYLNINSSQGAGNPNLTTDIFKELGLTESPGAGTYVYTSVLDDDHIFNVYFLNQGGPYNHIGKEITKCNKPRGDIAISKVNNGRIVDITHEDFIKIRQDDLKSCCVII